MFDGGDQGVVINISRCVGRADAVGSVAVNIEPCFQSIRNGLIITNTRTSTPHRTPANRSHCPCHEVGFSRLSPALPL